MRSIVHVLLASLGSTSAFVAAWKPAIGRSPTRAFPRCSAEPPESELEYRKRILNDPTYKAVSTPAKAPKLTRVSDPEYTDKAAKAASTGGLPLPLLGGLGTAVLALVLVSTGALSPEPPPPPPPGPLDYLPGALLVLLPAAALAALVGSGRREASTAVVAETAVGTEASAESDPTAVPSVSAGADVEGVVVPFGSKEQGEGTASEERQAGGNADAVPLATGE